MARMFWEGVQSFLIPMVSIYLQEKSLSEVVKATELQLSVPCQMHGELRHTRLSTPVKTGN